MTKVIFYDTETQGIPLWKQPSGHPDQPHIVQLGACLVDVDTRKVLSTLDVMVRPDGWLIPDEVAAIHGITTEMAADLGVPESLAVEMLLDMVGSRTRIAHNESFDARIVRIACMRHFEGQIRHGAHTLALGSLRQAPVAVLQPGVGLQHDQAVLHRHQARPVFLRAVDFLQVAQNAGDDLARRGRLQVQPHRHVKFTVQAGPLAVRLQPLGQLFPAQ